MISIGFIPAIYDSGTLEKWCESEYWLGNNPEATIPWPEYVRIWRIANSCAKTVPPNDTFMTVFYPSSGQLDFFTFHLKAGTRPAEGKDVDSAEKPVEKVSCTCSGHEFLRDPTGCKCAWAKTPKGERS